jgi:hypothetical protein
MPTAPLLLRAGVGALDASVGDYTMTVVFPFNSFKFWTVQQYADPSGADEYGSYRWRTLICLMMPWL